MSLKEVENVVCNFFLELDKKVSTIIPKPTILKKKIKSQVGILDLNLRYIYNVHKRTKV